MYTRGYPRKVAASPSWLPLSLSLNSIPIDRDYFPRVIRAENFLPLDFLLFSFFFNNFMGGEIQLEGRGALANMAGKERGRERQKSIP